MELRDRTRELEGEINKLIEKGQHSEAVTKSLLEASSPTQDVKDAFYPIVSKALLACRDNTTQQTIVDQLDTSSCDRLMRFVYDKLGEEQANPLLTKGLLKWQSLLEKKTGMEASIWTMSLLSDEEKIALKEKERKEESRRNHALLASEGSFRQMGGSRTKISMNRKMSSPRKISSSRRRADHDDNDDDEEVMVVGIGGVKTYVKTTSRSSTVGLKHNFHVIDLELAKATTTADPTQPVTFSGSVRQQRSRGTKRSFSMRKLVWKEVHLLLRATEVELFKSSEMLVSHGVVALQDLLRMEVRGVHVHGDENMHGAHGEGLLPLADTETETERETEEGSGAGAGTGAGAEDAGAEGAAGAGTGTDLLVHYRFKTGGATYQTATWQLRTRSRDDANAWVIAFEHNKHIATSAAPTAPAPAPAPAPTPAQTTTESTTAT